MDAWFIGFTADYVTGVWMGYDDNRPLTGVTGAGLPAEIWHEVMVRVSEGLPVTELPMVIPEFRAPPFGEPAYNDTSASSGNVPEEPFLRDGTVPEGRVPEDRVREDPIGNLLRDLLGQ